MRPDPDPVSIAPDAFEREVKAILDAAGAELVEYRSEHRSKVVGLDGVYEIDVLARFSALGVEFRVLVECKHQRNAVKRDVVQVLHDRVRATGAQKGILVSTAQFQSGALEYARAHGIALVQLVEGRSTYFTRGLGGPTEPPPWANIPAYAGWMVSLSSEGSERRSLLDINHTDALREFLGS
jgi:restriction system protein